MITYLWDTYNMSMHWGASPYNRVNGGPARYVSDLLRDPSARELQHRKIDWFMGRYGNHPNLLALDLMNEIDWGVTGPVPGNRAPQQANGARDPLAVQVPDPEHPGKLGWFRLGSQEEIRAWVDDMSAYAHRSWRRLWGDPANAVPGERGLGVRMPLLTVSTNNPDYIGKGDWLHRHPSLDLAAIHMYSWRDGGETTSPRSAISLARAGQRIIRTNYDRVDPAHPRPFLDTENGPLGYWTEHGTAHPDDRRMSKLLAWSEATSGAAGTGMRWPYPNYGYGDNPYLNPLSPEMEADLSALSRVAATVDWNRLDGTPRSPEQFAAVEDGTFSSAVGDRDQLFGFLARATSPGGAAQGSATRIRFGGLAPGPHQVTWYDSLTGQPVQHTTASGERFELDTPRFEDDLAVVVSPVGAKQTIPVQ